jgi:hypothetical protein
MAKTYDTTDLTLSAPSSLAWGLAWYRFLSNDKPVNAVYPQYSLDDEEVEGLLEITALRVDGQKYYLPHEALIMRITTDPTYAVQVSEESYSQTFLSPQKLAENIRGAAALHLKGEYPEDIRGLVGFAKLRLAARF